ncbi:CIC11C00000005616 [Sungouiella intermedia]|uniref:CIC11C00000003569 n=1 Tax=Sungouiella intermedia TaxID=45354 RepID=A0A1L0D8F9_9ASCO|nr:CIC11C00000003569 [[Candida] intermedia]SGZ52346.1 CIC11C00000005616 [[Candida] intermedia]
MSENLKRAELLFNRIMNQNKPDTKQPSQRNSSTYNSNNHYHHSNGNNQGNSHHRHSYKLYKNYSHNGHQTSAVLPNYDLPKRDPVKEAQDAVDALLPDQHVLPYCWTIWYHLRNKNKVVTSEESAGVADATKPAATAAAVDSYLQTTNEIEFPCFGNENATVKSIASLEQMWLSMSVMKKLHDLANGSELLVFKTGVNPVWEDPVNAKGGRWVFRFNHRFNPANGPELAKEVQESMRKVRRRTTLIWERLVLRTLGGSLIAEKSATKGIQLLNDVAGLVLSVRRDEDIISVWNSNLSFGKRLDDDDKKRGLTPFQARRVICDAVLRVIRECDVITQGSDCIETSTKSSTERVNGVTFEYRLHLDSSSTYSTNERRRGKHHHHYHKDEEKPEGKDEKEEV